MSERRRIRAFDIGHRQDVFLVSAVTTIVIIRLQLWLTNYPSLSPGRLHIAHLLYGGVLMLISIWLMASYVGRARLMPATILGGIGFGFFLDEVGKFITQDNDYFFKPTATIIYLVFILLFLVSRWTGRRPLTDRERRANAAALAAERFSGGMTARQRLAALELLEPLDDEGAQALRQVVEGDPGTRIEHPGRLERIIAWMERTYGRMIESPRFRAVMILLVVLGVLANVALLAASLVAQPSGTIGGTARDAVGGLSWANLVSLSASAAATVLAGLGIAELVRRRRLEAYRLIRLALLISIFLVYPFTFAESSFSATTGALLTLAAFGTVSAMLREEERRELEAGQGAHVAAAAG